MSDDLKSAIRALIKTPGNIPGLISISVIDRRGVPFFEEFADSREHDRTLKNCYRFTSIGSWEQRPAIKRLNQVLKLTLKLLYETLGRKQVHCCLLQEQSADSSQQVPPHCSLFRYRTSQYRPHPKARRGTWSLFRSSR